MYLIFDNSSKGPPGSRGPCAPHTSSYGSGLFISPKNVNQPFETDEMSSSFWFETYWQNLLFIYFFIIIYKYYFI